VAPFESTRRYRPDSNVLETVFVTSDRRARMTESLNSGLAGRLLWNEFGVGSTVWAEASACLVRPGRTVDARNALDDTLAGLCHERETFQEMIDPSSGAVLGNFPQGLRHLSFMHAASAVSLAMGAPYEIEHSRTS
jgi:hypothetical protein